MFLWLTLVSVALGFSKQGMVWLKAEDIQMLEIPTLEKGWLKKQLDQAEQEIASWPEWRRIDIDAQYKELLKHIEANPCSSTP